MSTKQSRPGSKATGKARHPHDASRPEPAAVRRALEKEDMGALERSLTPRQLAFAREYVVDFNGSAAAVRAGYSPTYADRQAHILLKHEGVRTYIDWLTQSKASKITSVDPDYLIQKVHEIIVKEDAKDGDKLRALELLMKHKGMFIERQEISGPDGKAIEMQQRTEEDASAVVTALRRMRKPDLKVVGGE